MGSAPLARRGGYARLPRAEYVCLCSVDGDRPSRWAIEPREQVVRCRDCAFAQGTATRGAKMVSCIHFITLDSFENPVPSKVEPDGFCAWGEPRKED